LAAPVRSAFEGLPAAAQLDEARQHLAASQAVPRRGRPGLMVAALALVAGLVIGLGGGRFTSPEPTIGWQEQVALYQALYTPETVAHLDADPALLEAQFDRASAALGRDLDPSDVGDLPGLELRRAQVLAVGDRALVQIVFASTTGDPIAFCIIADEPGPTEAPEFAQLAGLPTAFWAEGGYGFMVLGNLGSDDLNAVTERLTTRF